MGYSGDSKLGIQYKQCRKREGGGLVGKYPRNIVLYLLDGISRKTKCNLDEDIQKLFTVINIKNCGVQKKHYTNSIDENYTVY